MIGKKWSSYFNGKVPWLATKNVMTGKEDDLISNEKIHCMSEKEIVQYKSSKELRGLGITTNRFTTNP
jgi:hypothetical protein